MVAVNKKRYRYELDRAVPRLILAAVNKLFQVITKSNNERNSMIAAVAAVKIMPRWSENVGDDLQDRPLADMVREDVARLMASAPPPEE